MIVVDERNFFLRIADRNERRSRFARSTASVGNISSAGEAAIDHRWYNLIIVRRLIRRSAHCLALARLKPSQLACARADTSISAVAANTRRDNASNAGSIYLIDRSGISSPRRSISGGRGHWSHRKKYSSTSDLPDSRAWADTDSQHARVNFVR